MGVETLIAACIVMCVCAMLFDLLFVVYETAERHAAPHRTAKLHRMLNAQLRQVERHALPWPGIQRWLGRRLVRAAWMDAFIEVNAQLQQEKPKLLLDYYFASMELLSRLTRRIRTRPMAQRAQFAVLLHQLMLGGRQLSGSEQKGRMLHNLAEMIMPDIVGGSIYLREKTLRAVISIGDPYAVRHALQLLSGNSQCISPHLMADDLLAYPGARAKLLEVLRQDFPGYSTELKVTVINYLRLLNETSGLADFVPELLALMTGKKTHGEVRMAAIRFFGTCANPAAYPALLSLLQGKDKLFNYAAVAAASLRRYPGEETVAALMAQLSHENWYVRYNCADSLLALGLDPEDVVHQINDRYARDMLRFRGEVNRLRPNEKEVCPS